MYNLEEKFTKLVQCAKYYRCVYRGEHCWVLCGPIIRHSTYHFDHYFCIVQLFTLACLGCFSCGETLRTRCKANGTSLRIRNGTGWGFIVPNDYRGRGIFGRCGSPTAYVNCTLGGYISKLALGSADEKTKPRRHSPGMKPRFDRTEHPSTYYNTHN